MSGRGTYLLFLSLPPDLTLEVGRLGSFALAAGQYVYVGSAFGAGGLAARLNHHRRLAPRPHWHVDFLRRAARLDAIWYQEATVRREHDWARVFSALPGVTIPIPRFGASDCACPTHLFFCTHRPSLTEFQTRLDAIFPHDPPVQVLRG
ncbi:MAG: GIY-YIG nuclease family protein [Chloroflexi bacterium]|nr:GIY-YIG nuclease family protein [Chloroflexota bacterium]